MRRRRSNGACVIVAALVLASAACRGGAEHALLAQFFGASSLRDLTALAGVSTVVFEPREYGAVVEFSIARIVDDSADAKRVTVDAEVVKPDGARVRETILATLQRRNGRWMVTGFVRLPPRSGGL